MEDYQDNRLVRKYFKCSNCKIFDSKLINPYNSHHQCSKCYSDLKEISEDEFKKLKSGKKKQKEEDKKKKQRNKSSLHSSKINYNNFEDNNNRNYYNNNINNNNRNHNIHINQNNVRNNNNNYNNNNFNFNNNYHNNNQQHHHHNRENHHHDRRRRDQSRERINSNNFFGNFFGNIFRPFANMDFSMENPFRVTVQRQNVGRDIFDPIFSSFGSIFNGVFQDNFSSNFSSNYRGNFFNEILRILERNREEAQRNSHPPTSKENLNKLKKFDLTQKYCKLDKNGKYELPNCCICLSEINLGEKTVLLPCGHMFHWNCCLTWLQKNNTCPICRFEIK